MPQTENRNHTPGTDARQGLETLRTFFHAWLVDRDVDEALRLTGEDVFMISIMDVTAAGRDELHAAITATLAGMPRLRSCILEFIAEKKPTEGHILLLGRLVLRLPNDTFDYTVSYRFSALLAKRPYDFVISSLHLSLGEQQPSCPIQPIPLLHNLSALTEGTACPPREAEGADNPDEAIPHHAAGLLENFYDTMVDGIAKLSGRPEHPLVFANRGFYSMLGYTEEEFHLLCQGSMQNITHPVDLPVMLDTIRLMDQQRPRHSLKIRLMRKDLCWMWVRLDMSLSEEVDGGYPIFYCFYTDIDAQEAREREYKRQSSFFSLLSTEIDLGALIVRAEKNYPIVYFGDNMVDFLGYDSRAEIECESLGGCAQIIPSEDWKEVEKNFGRQLLAGDYIEGEFRVRKKNGAYRWVLAKGRKTVDDDGTPIIIFLWTDISRRKSMEQDLQKKAQLDPLTGVFNRVSTENAVEFQLRDRRKAGMAALFLIDMDNFKNVNDTLGHLVGDEILVTLAQILQKNSRGGDDIVGRLGGDEFVLFMGSVKSVEFLEQRAEKVTRDVFTVFAQRYPACRMTVSIGVAVTTEPATFDELYLIADKAMYKSKDQGKNTWRIAFRGQ